MSSTELATKLTGPQKVAILLMSVGKERSATVLKQLPEDEVAEIAGEIARLQTVPAETVEQVLTEFRETMHAKVNMARGGADFAREMLEASLGTAKAFEIMDLLSAQLVEAPFEFLRNADPRQVQGFIADEHPQTIALVLAHMMPEAAALVLSSFNEGLQRDVAIRLAKMDRTSPEVIERVESVLKRKLSTVNISNDFSETGGIQSLVDILNRSDRSTERLILEGLENTDEDLADEIRQLMFVFEDITTLDDRAVQLILRQVDNKDLATALKGMPQVVLDKITRNMSERAAETLLDEIQYMGPVRLKDVETAQGSIVRIIRTLEEAGQVQLSRSNDEFVE
ncbi:flagellar motor switch protein FliG [Stomatohabitans albus]|uniref:flagellar motor switch protein FliG n=1 Tax=Stomatohabitans albus TaxID=3110766 RepID=UPI00300C80AA